MQIDRSLVKRILVISLTNVGDVILTTPVIRTISKKFPDARIDVMVGPSGKEIFEKDPRIFKLIIYDKHMPMIQKRRLQLKLKRLRYDLVVDLRNTVFGLLIGPRFRTGTIQHFPSASLHRRDRHLYRLRSLGLDDFDKSYYIHIPKEDEEYISGLIREEGLGNKIVVLSPGAKSHLKRWTIEGFAGVADRLITDCAAQVLFVGLSEDEGVINDIVGRMRQRPHNLVNKTNARQLAALLKRSRLLITNDSAPLHLGCAVGAKVLAIFGPTDKRKYGPTGEFDAVIDEKLSCSPCESAACKFNYECMKLVSADKVFDAAKMMLEGYE